MTQTKLIQLIKDWYRSEISLDQYQTEAELEAAADQLQAIAGSFNRTVERAKEARRRGSHA